MASAARHSLGLGGPRRVRYRAPSFVRPVARPCVNQTFKFPSRQIKTKRPSGLLALAEKSA